MIKYELKFNLENEYINTRYDGLMVIISSHGTKGCIVSSDYKLITKKAIHRIFTAKKAINRKYSVCFYMIVVQEVGRDIKNIQEDQ